MLDLVIYFLLSLLLNPLQAAATDYTLEYHDYWVGGQHGSASYTVQGSQVRVLSYDENGAVVLDETRTLSEEDQAKAAELVRQAFSYRSEWHCSDSPVYRITVERGAEDVVLTHYLCNQEVLSPLSELADLLDS